MSEQVFQPAEAAAAVNELMEKARLRGPLTTEEKATVEAQRHERSLELWKEAQIRDAMERWTDACPSGMHESDWTHTKLSPWKKQIETILGYEPAEKGILASGPTGRGKSRAMWALMKKFCERGLDVRFYTAFDWFSELQQQVQYGRDDARGWIEAVARRKIVFIDDLGQQTVLRSREDWAESWFFRFLDIRVGEKLPLFITTNLRSGDFVSKENKGGDPMLRRILDICDPITFGK